MGVNNCDNIAQFKKVCGLAKDFKERHGRWPVPYKGNTEEHGLGIWRKKVKKSFIRGGLSEEQLEALREIQFPLLFQSKEWNSTTELLKQYIESGQLPGLNTRLRRFANRLLSGYSQLIHWKKEKLQSFDFKERYTALLEKEDKDWQSNFSGLLQHFRAHGELPSFKHEKYGWLSQQKKLARQGRLSPEYRRLFEKAGMSLHTPKRLSWEEEFWRFKNFIEVHGRNPRNIPGERPLYMWRCKQKKSRFEGRLSEKKVKMLNEINFSWEFRIAVSRNDYLL